MKRSKYSNKKVIVDGIKFASKHEASRYKELKNYQLAGIIKGLRWQVPFEVLPKQKRERSVKYIADFVYIDEAGNQIVEDAKGFKTPDYIIKRKLMLFRHGIKVEEV